MLEFNLEYKQNPGSTPRAGDFSLVNASKKESIE
jgi:hypothetical protein